MLLPSARTFVSPKGHLSPTRVASLLASRAALVVAILLGVRAVLLVAETIARRARFAGDLEWMEFGMVAHVLRILEHKPLYGPPSAEFIPYIYGPLYYYAGAFLSLFVENELFALRYVSIVSTIGIGVLLARTLHRAGIGRFGVAIAPALYASTFVASGGWMDLARVDSFFLLLEMIALASALHRGRRGAVLAGLSLALATATKQYALVLSVPFALRYALFERREGLVAFVLSFSLSLGGLAFFFHQTSAGWVWFWTWKVVVGHEFTKASLADVFREHALVAIPFLLLLASFGFVVLGRAFRTERSATSLAPTSAFLLASFGVVGLFQAYASFRHTGAFLNCLMPAHLALSLFGGVALGAERGRSVETPLAVLLIFLFLHANFEPNAFVPTKRDRAAAKRLAFRADPRAIVVDHSASAHPRPELRIPHPMALFDLERAGEKVLTKRVRREIRERFEKKQYSRVVLDSEQCALFSEMREFYRFDSILAENASYPMVAGSRIAPRRVYVPKSESIAKSAESVMK